MPTFLNEHFAENMLGKRVSFAVQPYSSGTGTIAKITPRMVEHKDFQSERGGVWVRYETYDLDIACEDGREVGALICGVPVRSTIDDLAGRTHSIAGVSRGQIYRAVEKGETIVIARCG